jgi:DnaJ-class molecular chaperone
MDSKFFRVLGISKSADSSEVRKAFANLAMTCHPDVSREPDAAEKFRLISEA